jgi:hypothetical protein
VHVLNALGLTAALAFVVVGAGTRDASAVCSTRHLTIFEVHDTAVLVAMASVTKAPKPGTGGGEVDLVIHEQLKGAAVKAAKARENASCTAGFYNVMVGKVSKTALVFVGENGEAVGFWSGVVEAPTADTLDALRAWSKAADDAARVEVLVTAIESHDQALSADAAYYLADEPALVLALTPQQIDRVDAMTGGDQWGPEIILARRRGAHFKALRRKGGLAADLRAIAAFDFERVTKPEELARIIERDRDLRSYKKVAALERCERRGRRLERFSIYNSRYPDRARWRALHWDPGGRRHVTPTEGVTSSRAPSPAWSRRA